MTKPCQTHLLVLVTAPGMGRSSVTSLALATFWTLM